MEWTMLCYDGTEYTLPTPVAWRLNYGLGTPCDSVWVKTLWSAGQESRLADGTRLRVTEKGETLFFGVIDECETQWSPAGCVAEITGRGLQALLLDNQAEAADYGQATLAEILWSWTGKSSVAAGGTGLFGGFGEQLLEGPVYICPLLCRRDTAVYPGGEAGAPPLGG
mgnify:CR=1 FL=1